jgi:hypothetical protein
MSKSLSKKKAHERKVRDYARFLRDDEDWDWAYIILVLQYKLKRTRLCIESNKIVASSKKIAREIKTVEDLFEAVLQDKYYEIVGKDFKKKYGSGKFIHGKKEQGCNLRSVSIQFRGETKGNRERIHREFNRLHRKADRALERDLNKAFSLMAKNIRRWWD